MNDGLTSTKISGGNVGSIGGDVYFTSSNFVAPAKIDDTDASAAETALGTAITQAVGLTGTAISQLGGQTLTPGVYDITSTTETGALVLNDEDQTDPLFVFQFPGPVTLTLNDFSTTTENAGTGSNPGSNVFWAVAGAAALQGGNSVQGQFLVDGSIQANNGTSLVDGSLLAKGAVVLGAVTVDDAKPGDPPAAAPLPATLATSLTMLAGLGIYRIARRKVAAA